MCWSWKISLMFSLFEFLSIVYLFRRHTHLDKWFIAWLTPISIQEFFQFCIWVSMLNNNGDGYTCTRANAVFSWLSIVPVWSVPTLGAWATYEYTAKFEEEEGWEQIRLFLLKHMIPFSAVLGVWNAIVFPLLIPSAHLCETNVRGCSYIGPHGHLVWPWVPVACQGKNWVIAGLILQDIGYYVITFSFFFLFRPYISMIFALVVPISAVVLRVHFGTEAPTIWCWSTGFVTLIALFWPSIVKHILCEEWGLTNSDSYFFRGWDQVFSELGEGYMSVAGGRL